MPAKDVAPDRAKIERGDQALAILEGSLVTEVIEEAKKNLHRKIENSAPEDSETREACYYDLRAINMLVDNLTSIRRHGDQERKKIPH